jgi:hypothetical protein
MSESNNNIPMRITQLEEAETFDYESYLPEAKAGSGTKKVKGSTLLAELINIRQGADGVTYPNAGDAVRTQLSNVKKALNDVNLIPYYSLEELITEHTGFLMANGKYSSDTNTHCKTTQLYPCKGGDIFRYKGVGQYSSVSVIFYTDFDIVSSEKYNSKNSFTDITIPNGVNGVRFSSFDLLANDIVLDVILPQDNIPDVNNSLKDYYHTLTKNIKITSHNGYLQENGNYSSDANVYSLTTEKIKCDEGDVFYYKGFGQLAGKSVLFYKKDIIISSEVYNSTTDYTKIIIPNGIDGVVFSSFANTIIGNIVLDVRRSYKNLEELTYKNGQVPILDYDKVIYITDFIEDKYIVASNGTLEDAAGSVVTDYIDLDNVYYLTAGGRTLYAAAGCVIYDKDYNFIKTIVAQGTEWRANIVVKNLIEEYPTAKYIRFSSLFNNSYPLTVYLYDSKAIGNTINIKGGLEDKSFYALGDSFTHGDWSNDEMHPDWTKDPTLYDASVYSYKTYVYYIAQRNKMILYNLAGNGYRLIDHVVGNNIYKQVPVDADYCTLMIGLNDATLNKPIGDIDSDDTTTFYGCLNVLMSYYRENRPNLHFGVIVLPNLKVAYRTALINSAVKYGYPYLDMYNDAKVPAFMAIPTYPAKNGMDVDISTTITTQNKVSADNWHPNEDAHKKLSLWIEQFIKDI